jgi:amino acid transporter
MTAVRAALVAVGLAFGVYGAVLVFDLGIPVLIRIAIWAAVGVAVHDFVFAPACVALGLAGRRVLPTRWQSPLAVAVLLTVVLVLLAIPVYDKPGQPPDNLTVVDRDYVAGLWIALAVVWICVPVSAVLRRRLPVGQDERVDQQRAEDVERQPPSV